MEITVIHSKRRTVSIRVNADLSVTVRAPLRMTKFEIDRLLQEKSKWICDKQEEIARRKEEFSAEYENKLTTEEIRELANKALKYIPERVAIYAKTVGVDYGRITIRNQRTRWGSCSSKGNLNFNCLLMLQSPELIDYVVVHELCHRKQMNHSKAFWNEVANIIPNYKELEKQLKKEGSLLRWQGI